MENTSERFELLRAMHTVVRVMNDEAAYMDWINTIPDDADEEELRDCAENDEIMQEASMVFTAIIRRYGKNGGYYVDGKVFG